MGVLVVLVLLLLVTGRFGARQVEQFAQFGEKKLVIGALGAGGDACVPAGDEGVEVHWQLA
ncbi:MAG: hypothetical protein B7Y40_00970 [Gammaproteobacteria bacterium 28-57-27]|nr:MAG: hypothetical protein B7Y40_00970 [Gammaproteobacteria bacterium 28-57-27]